MATQGKPRWYKPDAGLAARMVLTMFLLGLVYVVFAGVLWGVVGIPWPLLIVGAALIASFQLFFSDKIALASMKAQYVDEQEAPQLHDMIGRLAAQANLPKPRIAMVDTSIPNAFATGRNAKHATIAITTGLLRGQGLTPPEIEAVIAHELTHILNRDMLVMTIATFFSMIAALIVRSFMWSAMFGGMGGGYGRRGGGNNDNSGMIVLIAILASVITYVISFILIRALSRYRELAADRGSALITGAPEQLASALQRISGAIEGGHIPQKDFRQATTVNALFIVPALKGDSLATLFSTHPSLEKRLEQLHEMQQQMESARNL
ncbi:MAG TPA: zinc metalloprotease HtpX [Ktedonobacterales bacterium]|nr:zinc metalloprotease HtpX [Ktedonobacterales bacterium]